MNNAMARRLRRPHPMVPAKAPEPANVKPFALQHLESGDIDQQLQSPLFAILPKEIRDLVFEYALASYPDPDRPYSNTETYARPGVSGHPRIATELLRTCKAVYIETYQLPITLNPIIIYHDAYGHVPPHARRGTRNLLKLVAWQLAALHMVDISLQQFHLEGRKVISQAAHQLKAGLRFDQHQAANTGVAQPDMHTNTTPDPPGIAPHSERRSGLEMPSADYNVPRPISKVTLRLGRTEWWTWEDSPNSVDHLAIDPGHGDGHPNGRCTTELMMSEAERRRSGKWAGWASPDCWGVQIAEFKGLRELECVFETFKLKEKQLDTVIECAKIWIFPMGDGYELSWDGKVEASEWTGVDEYGYERGNAWLREHVSPPDLVGNRTDDEIQAARETRRRFEEENPLPDHRLFVVRAIRFTRSKCDFRL